MIYVDADMLIRRDLGDLWDEPQGDHAVLAVTDIAAPRIRRPESPSQLRAVSRTFGRLHADCELSRTRAAGGRTTTSTAACWSSISLTGVASGWLEQMLDCLRTIASMSCGGISTPSTSSWPASGVLSTIVGIKAHTCSSIRRGARARWIERVHYELCNDPWIVHFCSPSKPWHYLLPASLHGRFPQLPETNRLARLATGGA